MLVMGPERYLQWPFQHVFHCYTSAMKPLLFYVFSYEITDHKFLLFVRIYCVFVLYDAYYMLYALAHIAFSIRLFLFYKEP